MNGTALAAPLLVLLAPLAAVAAEEVVPLPRGWIGTTSEHFIFSLSQKGSRSERQGLSSVEAAPE